jgi:hypothetical protein
VVVCTVVVGLVATVDAVVVGVIGKVQPHKNTQAKIRNVVNILVIRISLPY